MVDSDKRLLPLDDDSAVKRIKLDKLSDDGPLTQKDVVYFKKEAIWRQMQLYKSQVAQLKRELVEYDTNMALAEEKIATLDTWYDQLIALLIPFSKEDNLEINENLLLTIDDGHLQVRRNKLLAIITYVMSNLKEKLSANIDTEQLSQQIAQLTTENKKLSKSKHDLLEKIDALSESLARFKKQELRQESTTLKRVDASLVKQEPGPVENGNDPSHSEESNDKNISKIESNDGSSKSPAESDQQAQLNNEELEKLTMEVEELRSTTQLLNSQLKDLTEKYQSSEQSRISIESELNHLPESRIVNSIYYKNLLGEHESLKVQLAKLDKINDMNRQKLQEFETNQNDISNLLQQETKDELNLLRSQLSKSETDLVRIRSIRDELLSKNAILKAETEQQKSSEELSKLNSILSERINHLEKEQCDKFSEKTNEERLQEQCKEDLIKLLVQLNYELKEIESAFKDTKEIATKKLNDSIDQLNLIKKLNIEKTKADQKYFASMRLKDSIQSENKLLKVQIGKSQELIKNLNDLEKNYLNKIDILTKSINDYKTIKENSVSEVSKLQEQNKSLLNWKQDKQQDFKKYQENIKNKQEEINKLSQELSQKEVQINKLDKNLKSTESLLQKFRTNNTSSILAEDEQQIEALRSIAKCSVCSKNWKDTVITVCGHVFCNHCTQERLAARLRRCPSCNKGFSVNDLLTIHL